jgi:hypothetical protein
MATESKVDPDDDVSFLDVSGAEPRAAVGVGADVGNGGETDTSTPSSGSATPERGALRARLDLGAAGAGEPPRRREAKRDLLTLAQWGQHLRADYRHDKLRPDTPYNIGGNSDEAKYQKGDVIKEFCEEEFFNYAKGLFHANAEFQARMNAVVKFTLPTFTGTYKKKVPDFTDIRNENIGVVTDNGEFITHTYLGAMHVVTFGNIVDPAGTPIARKDKPIYYEPLPTENNIYIDLQQFGFNPEVMRGVWIAEVLGGTQLRSAWVNNIYQVLDPIAKRSTITIDEPINSNLPSVEWSRTRIPGFKRINIPGGYYASKETAGSDYEKIGKTLGDTMIVASAMPEFIRYDLPENPRVPNPFYGAKKESGWTQLNSSPDQQYYGGKVPQLLAIKTSDILNAARGVFKNVPTILERVKPKDMLISLECYPPSLTSEQLRDSIPFLYTNLIADVNTNYNNLIKKFQDMLEEDGNAVKTGYGLFRPNDTTWIAWRDTERDRGKRQRAAVVVRRIIDTLEYLKGKVAAYFASKKLSKRRRPGEESLREYNQDAQDMLALTPQTDETLRYEEADRSDRRFMRMIIPITRIPKGGVEPTEIYLYSAFRAIHDTDTREGLSGNPHWRVFDQRFPPPPAPAEGGGRGGGAIVVDYENVLNDYVLSPPLSGVIAEPSIRVNGEEIGRMGTNLDSFSFPADSVPITMAFIDYYHTDFPNPIICLNILHRLYKHPDNESIMENSMLKTIENEFERMIDNYRILIPIDGAVGGGGAARRVVPDPIAIDILCFNKFTCHINSKNEVMYRGVDDRIRFDYMKDRLNEQIEREIAAITAAAAAAAGVATTAAERRTPPPGVRPPFGAVFTPDAAAAAAAAAAESGRAEERAPGVVAEILGSAAPAAPGGTPGPRGPTSALARMLSGLPDESGSGSQSATQRLPGGDRTPRRRKNRKSTYRLKKKTGK